MERGGCRIPDPLGILSYREWPLRIGFPARFESNRAAIEFTRRAFLTTPEQQTTEKTPKTPSVGANEQSEVYALANNNLSPDELRTSVPLLLKRDTLIPKVSRLPRDDQVRFVDRADMALPTIDVDSAASVASFGDLCSSTRLLPRSAMLHAGLEKLGSAPVVSTGWSDEWRGKHGNRPVTIKAIRSHSAQHLYEQKEVLWKRVPALRRLSHPNLLPFYGVNMTLFRLAIVYDSTGAANIIEYSVSHPDVPRTELLLQATEGLKYLHSLDIPHGDLRPGTVRIDSAGNVRLTDHGLGDFKRNPQLTMAVDPRAIETPLAPELSRVTGASVTESKPADIFALVMLTFELLTGKRPFSGQPAAIIALLISQGIRPELPLNAEDVGLTAQVQNLLQRGWRQDPLKRPTVHEVIWVFKNPQPPMSKSESVPTDGQAQQPKPGIQGPKSRRSWLCGLF